MKLLSLTHLWIVWGLLGTWLTQYCSAQDCKIWPVKASNDPRADIESYRAKYPEKEYGIYHLMTLILAYNKQDTLDGFLQRLFDLDQTINSCDTGKTEGFKMEVATTSRNHPDGAQFTTQKYSITLNNTDLEYAAATDTPIWPAIVRKTVEAIQNDQNTVRLLRGRNNTHTDGLFDCIDHGVPSTKRQKEKRLYLCKLSDIVTRITGVQLRTSDKIMEGPESDHVGELLDKAEKHLVIVFENWAPKYLVRSNDRPTNHFTAVKLDVKKRGESHDMFFDLKSWTPADVFAYKDIIDHYGGEEKDVHIVYTFPS